MFRRDRPDNTSLVNHGGILVYVKRGIVCERLEHLEKIEHEVVWFKINGAKRDIILCCAYRAPIRGKLEFVEYLELCFDQLGPLKEVIIMGDLNFNFASDADSGALRTLLQIYGYDQLINTGTHFFKTNRCSTIDVICANRRTKVISSGTLDYDPGQEEYHIPVYVEYLVDQLPIKLQKRTGPDFSERNIQKFVNELGSVQWEWEGNTVEHATEMMNVILQNLFYRCFPTKSFEMTSKSLTNITPVIRAAKAEKYRLLAVKRLTGAIEDRRAFNRQCDQLRRLCSAHKRDAFDEQLKSNFSDSRKIWKTLKHFLPISRTTEAPPMSLKLNDIIINDQFQVAEQFNDYFTNIGESLAQAIPIGNDDPLDYVAQPIEGSTFSLNSVTHGDVLKEINKISPYKSVSDLIPFRILKRALGFLVIPITLIINLSFAAAEVPAALKRAVVTCIFKDGARDSVANYRPISVLCLVGKVIESIVQKRLTTFLTSKNLLYDYQSAYRTDHSCEMALNDMLSNVYRELDYKKEAIVVFLDLKKAFDTIDRNILFRKMDRYGIRGHALSWFKSLLSNRSQCVKVGNKSSLLKDVNVGVPQGSGLGPLLFSLYVNDIHRACDIPKTMLFADDTALIYTGDISARTINESLGRFARWLTVNKLTLNCSKTKFMVFSKKRQPSSPHLVMNGTEIEQVTTIKYLGVTLDDNLTFATHIDNVCKKLGHIHSVLYNNKSFITRDTGETLISALALPILMYSSTVYHRCAAIHLRKLDVLYKKMIRIVYRLPYDSPTRDIYRNTKFIPLCLMRQIQAAQFAFRCLSGFCAAYLANTIILSRDDALRRRPPRRVAAQVENYLIPFTRLDIVRQDFVFWSPLLLNSVPVDIIQHALANRRSVEFFTNHYRRHVRHAFLNCVWSRTREASGDYI
jgi:hypothetical protein